MSLIGDVLLRTSNAAHSTRARKDYNIKQCYLLWVEQQFQEVLVVTLSKVCCRRAFATSLTPRAQPTTLGHWYACAQTTPCREDNWLTGSRLFPSLVSQDPKDLGNRCPVQVVVELAKVLKCNSRVGIIMRVWSRLHLVHEIMYCYVVVAHNAYVVVCPMLYSSAQTWCQLQPTSMSTPHSDPRWSLHASDNEDDINDTNSIIVHIVCMDIHIYIYISIMHMLYTHISTYIYIYIHVYIYIYRERERERDTPIMLCCAASRKALDRACRGLPFSKLLCGAGLGRWTWIYERVWLCKGLRAGQSPYSDCPC